MTTSATEALRAISTLLRDVRDVRALGHCLGDLARLAGLDAMGAVVPGHGPAEVAVLATGVSGPTVEVTAAHLVPGPLTCEVMTRADAPAELRQAWEAEGFHHGLAVVATYPGGPDARLLGFRREQAFPEREATRVAFEAAAIGVSLVLERTTHRPRAATRSEAEDTSWLRVVLAAVQAPLVLLDLHGVVRALNAPARRLLGLSDEAAVGARLATLWNESTAPVSFSPESPGWNLTAALPDGRRVEAQSHVLFGPAGTIEGALLELQLTEVMERRRGAQSRAARLQALGAMTSTVAHDLNNLLLPLVTASSLLDECRSDEERAEEVAFLTDAATRAASMVRELLDFGRGTPSPVVPCHVESVVQRTQKLIRRALPSSISLVTEFHRVPRVHCAETDLVRTLINLCMNARYAMDSGGNLIMRVREVTLTAPEPGAWKPISPGTWVVLEVQDTGTGIEPSRLATLFQPYETTRFSSGGTGLGLAMVRDVLERCGGAAQVSSLIGAGTTMRLFLQPAEVSPPPTPPAGGRR
jgi:signal transduction histidine kinase